MDEQEREKSLTEKIQDKLKAQRDVAFEDSIMYLLKIAQKKKAQLKEDKNKLDLVEKDIEAIEKEHAEGVLEPSIVAPEKNTVIMGNPHHH